MGKKLTQEEWIEKAKSIHNDKYDYSKVKYVNSATPVYIKCNRCGNEFLQVAYYHLSGNGCPKCGYELAKKKKSYNTSVFIEKAKKIHGDKYDYSNVNYTNSQTKVCIICPEHGEFWQTPVSHLQGCGCRKCADNFTKDTRRYTTEQFIKKAHKIHGDKYDYSKVEYINTDTPVRIICKTCGSEFVQTPHNHLNGSGCKRCFDNNKRGKS